MKLPSEQAVTQILADTHSAFHFGSVNKGTIPISNKQLSFLHNEVITQLTASKNIFQIKLRQKKLPFARNREIEALYQSYICKKNPINGLKLLSAFYDHEALETKFTKIHHTAWEKDWLLNLDALFALGDLQKTQQEYLQKKDVSERRKFKLYQNMCKNGVPNHPEMRKLYLQNLVTESVLTTTFGVGNCEPMADFALLNAIEKSNELACEINYIRFPECEYEELNAIVLGNWPDKGCLIVCPWLGEKGKISTWQGSLEATEAFSHYQDCKSLFYIKPGAEMDQFRELLETIKFSEKAKEITSRKTNFEEQANRYRQVFSNHIKAAQTNNFSLRNIL